MENKLESLIDKRSRFLAIVSGFGKVPSYKGQWLETITLKDIRLDGQDEVVLPEITLTKGRLFEPLRVGDEISFNARLALSMKKATGEHRYRMERPTSLSQKKVSDEAIKALLFTNEEQALILSHRLNGEGFHFGMVLHYAPQTVASLSLLEPLEDDDMILIRCCALLVMIAEGMKDERSYPFLLDGFQRLLKGSSNLGELTLFDEVEPQEKSADEEQEEPKENREQMANWLNTLKSEKLFDSLESYSAFFAFAFKQLTSLKVTIGRKHPPAPFRVDVEQLAEHVTWVQEQWGEATLFPSKRWVQNLGSND